MDNLLTDISSVWGGPHSLTTSPHSPKYVPGIRSNPPKEIKVSNAQALSLGGLAVEGRWAELRAACLGLVKSLGTANGSWGYFAQELVRLIDNPKLLLQTVQKTGITTSGNMKLPFAIWAEMPVVTCPGAGGVKAGVQTAYGATSPCKMAGCAEWCYSLKGLRNPSVWFSRMKNTIAMGMPGLFDHLEITLDKLIAASVKKGKPFILRIYVDGDFRDQATIKGWMALLNKLDQKWNMMSGQWKPTFIVYGYSKSWPEFLALEKKIKWPRNYALNVSSGSRHGSALESRMLRHPAARGRFVAVDPVQVLEKVYGPQSKWPDQLHKDVQWWHEHTKLMGEDPADIKTGSVKKVPGMIAQSATFTLMRTWLNGKPVVSERPCFVCPISCATCPAPMLGGSTTSNKEAIEQTVRTGKVSPMFESKGQGSHACYSAKGRDILIGLH